MKTENYVGDLTQLPSDAKQDALKLDQRHAQQIKGAEENLLRSIRFFIDPCSEKQIFKNVPGRKQYKVTALRILLRDGKIFRIGSGKRGDPFLYFAHPVELEQVNHLACLNEQNSGSQTPPETKTTATPSSTPSDELVAPGIFKEYKMPNGETLRLTKDEFDRVVDLFRLLHQQSQNNGVT